MKDHELAAATASRPAKYDGCAIFMAYKAATNANDKTRQDADEALHAELSLVLPANVSGTQFAMHIGKFNEESEPYLLRKLTPELHVEWIVARLPAKLESDARAIRRALRSEGKASDVEEAMRRCMEVCDDAYDSTLGEPDVGAAVLQHVAALVASRRVARPSEAIRSLVTASLNVSQATFDKAFQVGAKQRSRNATANANVGDSAANAGADADDASSRRVLHGIPKAEPATNRRGRWAFEVKRRPLPLF